MRRVDQQRRVDQKDFHDFCFRPDPRERDVIAEAERSLRRTDVQDVSPRGIFLVRFSFASFDEATITKFLTLFELELPRCTETSSSSSSSSS